MIETEIPADEETKELPPKVTIPHENTSAVEPPVIREDLPTKFKAEFKLYPPTKFKAEFKLYPLTEITIEYYPTIVICKVEEDVPAGVYFVQNVHDSMIRGKVQIFGAWIEYDGNGQIEVCAFNLAPNHPHPCRLMVEELLAKMIQPY